jgi:serine/threonine-protein kinase HipA
MVVEQCGLPVYPDEQRLFGGIPSFIAKSLPDHLENTVSSTSGIRASNYTR